MTWAAALFALDLVALAAVVTTVIVAHRRGGLRVEVRIWWGNDRGNGDPPDQ